MCPGVLFQDSHRKIGSLKLNFVRIVMSYGRHSRTEVLDRSPVQTSATVDIPMDADRRGFPLMNVIRPGEKVRIGTLSESREQIELQMVVGIDQPGQQK